MRVDRIKMSTEMLRQDLSVKELSEKSGVSRVTVSAVKSGKRCSTETAAKLAAALGVDVLDILEDDE